MARKKETEKGTETEEIEEIDDTEEVVEDDADDTEEETDDESEGDEQDPPKKGRKVSIMDPEHSAEPKKKEKKTAKKETLDMSPVLNALEKIEKKLTPKKTVEKKTDKSSRGFLDDLGDW